MISNIQNIITNQDFSTSVGVRVGYWIVAYEIFKDNPVIGVGVSDSVVVSKEYASNSSYNLKSLLHFNEFHNDFLQILTQTGLIGALLYILIFYNILKIKINHMEYKNLPIVFVSVFIISSIFENMFHFQFPMVLFALFVGIFLAQNRIENNI